MDDFSKPLVSVIVATFRRGEPLKKALDSLVSQTYENIEIIIIDDNGNEEWNKKVEVITSSILSITNFKILCIRNQVNYGSAETRNIGIRTASGKYITFLDDDDVYLPSKIEKQVAHMIATQSDFCITNLNLYDEAGELIERRNRDYIIDTSPEQLIKYHLMYHMTGTDTMMFKKDYLMNIGGFPPINLGDEFYLMLRSIENGGKFSYLNDCEIMAYVHSKADSLSNGESKIKCENDLFEYKKSFFVSLASSEVRYIKMRHYAVLAFAEKRRKNILAFIKYAFISFISSPINCVNEYRRLKAK